jgi:hypothetical protein
MAGVSTAAGPSEGTAAPARGRQTAADMLRSMLLVLAGVLALVLLAPKPDAPVRQPVDVAGTAQQAGAGGLAVVPELPDGWSPNAARFRPPPGQTVPTWHVGYVTQSGRYAGLDVARDVTPRWLNQVTSRGEEVGVRAVAGDRWRELVSPDGKRRSLVLEQGDVTTVVTGTAVLDELVVLAEAATGG